MNDKQVNTLIDIVNEYSGRGSCKDIYEVDALYALEELKTYQKGDAITITWCIEDVKSLDESLTDEQCRKVLGIAERKHDANYGIGWDTLQVYIDYIKGK